MGRVQLVMVLSIVHDRWGSRSNPSINGHLHYPTDMDRTLNETTTDKILQYRTDGIVSPSHPICHDISFMSVIVSTSGRLHGEFECLLFLQTHRETDLFLATSGVQVTQTNYHFRRSVFSSQLKFLLTSSVS